MELALYGGVIVAVLATGFCYRLRCKRGRGGQKEKVISRISDFYSTQDQGHNY